MYPQAPFFVHIMGAFRGESFGRKKAMGKIHNWVILFAVVTVGIIAAKKGWFGYPWFA